jgi:hypothetical protein
MGLCEMAAFVFADCWPLVAVVRPPSVEIASTSCFRQGKGLAKTHFARDSSLLVTGESCLAACPSLHVARVAGRVETIH